MKIVLYENPTVTAILSVEGNNLLSLGETGERFKSADKLNKQEIVVLREGEGVFFCRVDMDLAPGGGTLHSHHLYMREGLKLNGQKVEDSTADIDDIHIDFSFSRRK